VPDLVAQGVTKRFGGLTAVDDVSMSVREGSITAMIGPNGAGKTTLFNVLTGFERADGGTIEFGRRLERLPPWRIARLGLVRTFQTPIGFPKLSVWENLMVGGSDHGSESVSSGLLGPRRWGRRERDANDRATQLLADLRLQDYRDALLEDLPPGDVKLVDFARQLIARPKMLLLDEPASGVDPGNIGRLSDLIRRINRQGITILIIDHNIGFVLGIAQHVYVLAEGTVIADGPPEEIARDERVIEVYLGGTH
jgi:ABC-type branched-subunit amino acid transport system ATPase component